MMIPKLNRFIRQGNITFSRSFLETVRSHGFRSTRRNHFIGSSLVINHGNHNPMTINDRALRFYVLNNPNYIHTCSNKLSNYRILSKYYPKTYNKGEKINFPVILKPVNGHHGYGIKYSEYNRDLNRILRGNDNHYIIQDKIDIKYEYRFNVLDKHIYQVSRKERLPSRTSGGGYEFAWNSLGNNAGISDKFWNFVYNIIEDYHKEVGNNMAHYCIDVIKGMDNNYYLTEMNSACGLGDYTMDKLVECLDRKLDSGELEKYRVR